MKFSWSVLTQTLQWAHVHTQDRVLGPFGVDRVNSAGRELHDLLVQVLDSKRLCLAATFFAKPACGTWRHPRSKNRFQLDHVLIYEMICPECAMLVFSNKVQLNLTMHSVQSYRLSFALPEICLNKISGASTSIKTCIVYACLSSLFMS